MKILRHNLPDSDQFLAVKIGKSDTCPHVFFLIHLYLISIFYQSGTSKTALAQTYFANAKTSQIVHSTPLEEHFSNSAQALKRLSFSLYT